MSNLLKKLLFSFLAFLLFIPYPLFLNPSLARAQSSSKNWYHQDYKDWYIRVYDSPDNDVFGERYTAAQVQWIWYGIFANTLNAAAGVLGIEPKTIACIFKSPPILAGAVAPLCGIGQILRSIKILGIGYNESSSNEGIAEAIFLKDRPLSGITYLRKIPSKLSLVPEVKAQTGFGFTALNPVQIMWGASRNVAYGLLVFAILVLSFMIMFRVKINPQTVITVQSAIPKTILALIFITFSYAIAGLMVDIMYIVIGFISLIFSTAWTSLGFNFLNVASPKNMFDLMTIGPGGTGIFGILFIYFAPLSLIVILLIATGVLLFPTGAGTIVGLLLIGIALVLILAMMIFFFKVVWTLFKAFAFVVLLVIFAPLQLALGVVIPEFGFGQWLKSLAANLAVFPVVGTFFALSAFFVGAAINALLQGITGATNLIGPVGWPPILSTGVTGTGSLGVALLYFGLSVVIFALVPKVSDIIKSVIEGKPFAYGTAIGEAVGLPVTAARFGAAAGVGRGLGILTRHYSLRQKGIIDPLIQELQKLIAGGR